MIRQPDCNIVQDERDSNRKNGLKFITVNHFQQRFDELKHFRYKMANFYLNVVRL
jgi:hypothetical protein